MRKLMAILACFSIVSVHVQPKITPKVVQKISITTFGAIRNGDTHAGVLDYPDTGNPGVPEMKEKELK